VLVKDIKSTKIIKQGKVPIYRYIKKIAYIYIFSRNKNKLSRRDSFFFFFFFFFKRLFAFGILIKQSAGSLYKTKQKAIILKRAFHKHNVEINI
jgi:hypothetical protein